LLAPLRGLGYLRRRMRVADFLKVEAVLPRMAATTKGDVLVELAETLARTAGTVSTPRVLEVLSEREKVGSTGMEKGVAIPHGRLGELQGLVACFGVSRSGVDFDARDGARSHFFFALVAPENSAGVHLKALSKISRLFRSETLRDAILATDSAEGIFELISQEDGKA
jgi:PTS system nitrogen regulatory IIA component